MFEFFQRLVKSRWLPWLGMVPFTIVPLLFMFNGEVPRGLGLLAVFASAIAGFVGGYLIGKTAGRWLSRLSSELGERIGAGLAAFGFLYLPALVGHWTNSRQFTRIELDSLEAHLLWACFGGALFFCLATFQSEK